MENFVNSSLLFELEKLLQDARYSLSHFSLPIPDYIGNASTDNRIILDEMNYATNLLSSSLENDIQKLNNWQKTVFDAICNSVLNNEGKTFFLWVRRDRQDFFIDNLAELYKE
jgi:hypothetical protein